MLQLFKSQLISKCSFGVTLSTKIATKLLSGFLPRQISLPCYFGWNNVFIKSFWFLLTFSRFSMKFILKKCGFTVVHTKLPPKHQINILCHGLRIQLFKRGCIEPRTAISIHGRWSQRGGRSLQLHLPHFCIWRVTYSQKYCRLRY